MLLAPIAGISGCRLAAAVSDAGGLGFIGGGYGDRDWLVRQLAGCAGKRFGVGFITWALRRQPELLDLALAAQPRAGAAVVRRSRRTRRARSRRRLPF